MKKEILMGLTALLISCNSNSTPKYDTTAAKMELAHCLVDKGALMYGFQGCPWCTKQEEDLGQEAWNVFKQNYVDCFSSQKNEARCAKEDVPAFPYWKFQNGKALRGYKPLEILAKESGCDQTTGQR